MEFEHEFTVPVPMEAAWSLLLDVERVAPCMPGATLDSVEGDEYVGRLKVRLGAMTITYRGGARIVSADERERAVTIEGSGKEARGSGTAVATINARLHQEGDSTRVSVRSKLNVTGRPAQFERDVLSEVGAKLIDRFAKALALELEPGRATEAGGGARTTPKSTAKTTIKTTPETTAKAESGTKPTAAALEPGRPLKAVEAARTAEAVETAPTVEAIKPPPATTEAESTAATPVAESTAASPAEGTATSPAEGQDILDQQGAAQAAASGEPPLRPVTPISSARRNEDENDDAINLMEVAGPAVAKRAAPVAAALVAVFAIRHLVRRRRGRHHRR